MGDDPAVHPGPPGDGTASDDPTAQGSGGLRRRDLLRGMGLGGAAVLGGGWLGRERAPRSGAGSAAGDGTASHGAGAAGHAAGGEAGRPAVVGSSAAEQRAIGEAAGAYGHAARAPVGMGEDALRAVTVPPPFDGRRAVREYELTVTERQLSVGDGVVVDAWTYAGSVPGPILRATEGDRLRLRMANRTGRPHNVHLHGRHDPAMDGWEPIPPGAEFTYDVVAEPFGLHPYHCHTAPVAEHVGRGLYGAMIVDPPGGRPDAHEFVLVLGGWDLDGDGRNELVCFNGVAGFYHAHPLRVPVGEPVRVYLVNMLEHEPVASFHLHAQTFDVIRSGTALEPHEHTDTVTLSQGERAVLEFTLPARGRYLFHPHQSRLAELGAMGWFAAI